MPVFLIYLVAIFIGASVAVMANAIARRMVVNPGLSAGTLSVVAAIWSCSIAIASISAHPGLAPEAQGEIFGEIVGGPALFAFVICFIVYRRSARLAAVAVNKANKPPRRYEPQHAPAELRAQTDLAE